MTFDLFSALIDSRAGGSAVFAELADERGWPLPGERLYEFWDARNKASQRDLTQWVPFAEHCRRALAATYGDLGLSADPDADAERLLASVGEWPLWPDVPAGLSTLTDRHLAGVLSNVDDDVFARTRVAPLVDDEAVFTSQRLRAYKPSPAIYHRALNRAGGELVHVASSARDVRGALEAGIRVIRLQRPGHHLDPDGPTPALEVTDLGAVARALDDQED